MVVSAPTAARMLALCLTWTLLLARQRVQGAKLADIYWNSTNSMFRIDNTDHIIDVNRGNQNYEFDQLDLICPYYRVGTPPSEMETYMIYLVSRQEYETCTLSRKGNLNLVAKCDGNAGRALKYTITFRSFTPQPGGKEYKPGEDYHLISTSSGTPGGLHQDHGGACRQHNMRVTFKVCCRDFDDRPIKTQPVKATASSEVPTTATTVAYNPLFRTLRPSLQPKLPETRYFPSEQTEKFPNGFSKIYPVVRPEDQEEVAFSDSSSCLSCGYGLWLLIALGITTVLLAVFVIR